MLMEPGYIVVMFAPGADGPWVSSIRCRTMRAAKEIVKNFGGIESDDLVIWIIDDTQHMK